MEKTEKSEKPVKYIYKIRSRNGVIVSNLQIYGRTEEEARQKLEQMYRSCEVIESGTVPVEHNGHFSYEDVMDIISKD
jgi:DNA-nicking Smr family endonuclease